MLITWVLEPNISFENVPIPRPHPSTTTYVHPCPPTTWHVPTHARPCYSNCAHVFNNCHIINKITNNIAPMPTQNPWAWVGKGMGTQCRALVVSCLATSNPHSFNPWNRYALNKLRKFVTNKHIPKDKRFSRRACCSLKAFNAMSSFMFLHKLFNEVISF